MEEDLSGIQEDPREYSGQTQPSSSPLWECWHKEWLPISVTPEPGPAKEQICSFTSSALHTSFDRNKLSKAHHYFRINRHTYGRGAMVFFQLLVEASSPSSWCSLQPKGNLGSALTDCDLPQVCDTVFLHCDTVGLVNEALGAEFMFANASLALVADYNPASKLQRVYYHMFHFPF